MGFRKAVTAATVAVAMMAVPTLAQAASPASRLSVGSAVSGARAGADRSDESKLGGGGVILAVLAAAAVIGGIVVAVDGGNDNEGPVSN
ncbi:hypothetical protein SAMN06295912_109134 [Sphingomonas laterariae]|uniref:Uncharacterized protein n=1 Tax=Edaphosphingomonas laterariae TaxID=861865 RepID=A0A239FNB3_9SPHN|nr:hypothetical protein [Sphingomonas laterariae]SNS58379.1 hypothetical protein SAMN06295912_109134 [Sphingomonas laterariae]